MNKQEKHVEPRERVAQRSIGFNFRQIEFFDKYRDFKPDAYCRKVIDEQIAQIDSSFLSKMEQNKND